LRAVWALLLLFCIAHPLRAAASPDFDFQALQRLIEHGRIGSIDELLAALPADLRSHYVLIFSSRSSQEASFRDPRAILYGPDAHLTLSFNGNPAAHGYGSLETMEFDAIEARFRLREIRFVASPAKAAQAIFSEIDPVRCQRCHGAPSRPIWDASPLWPGAYGERYRSNLTADERTGLRQFLAQQPRHPRYRYLVAAERFAHRGTFAPEARDEYAGERQEPPNAELSRLLGRMNMQMIARQLRGQDGFDAFRYALLGAAEGDCGDLLEFLPAAQRSATRSALREFTRITDSANALQQESKRLRALPGARASALFIGSAAAPSTLSGVRFLAEAGLGITTRDWTMALEKDTYDFTAPDGGSGALASALRAAVAPDDAQIGDLQSTREHSANDRYCVHLRERSRSALAALPQAGIREEIADRESAHDQPGTAQSLLQHCASCHANGVGRPLPFDQPPALAPLLRGRASAHGDLLGEILYRLSPGAGAERMPRDANLTPAQREALSGYLTDLAAAP
jgi:mono/diheme cytochrome c family protein